MHADSCRDASLAEWQNPGGVSPGLTFCIKTFVALTDAGQDAYELIDKADVPGVVRKGVHRVMAWHANMNKSGWRRFDDFGIGHRVPYTGDLGDGEWMVPPDYKQEDGEARLVFVHGGNAGVSGLGSAYAGHTMRLANWTGMPLLAFNYLTEPLVPWPGNVRNVFWYLAHALKNGPHGPGKAGSLLLVADSEGTLVAMHTALLLLDADKMRLLGYHEDLADVRAWLAGIILISPVIDVSCQTPSFEWNCFNRENDTGDPDTGDCSSTPNISARIADCRWSYLNYFFGFDTVSMAADANAANASWEARREFFEQPLVNPLRADLSQLPPLLVLGAPRDYFYSDASMLGELACLARADIEMFNPTGTFHDFLEYSTGCGGPSPMEEAIEGFERIRVFAHTRSNALKQTSKTSSRGGSLRASGSLLQRERERNRLFSSAAS